MSKGRGPGVNNRPDVTTREPAGEVEITPSEECWEFPLEMVEDGATKVSPQTPAVGSIHEQRVLVRTIIGVPLGYAPSDIAFEMIAAARRMGARLAGVILAAHATEGVVWVRLCLN